MSNEDSELIVGKIIIPPPSAPTEEKESEKKENVEKTADDGEEKKEENNDVAPPPKQQIVPPPPPPTTSTTTTPTPPKKEVVLDNGTLIWVKVEGYPWWPARVVNDNLADDQMKEERIESDTNLVQFFGDNSIFWINANDIESCLLYKDNPNLMDGYDGEFKDDLKKANITMKRLHRRKKRKREKDLLLKERELEGAAKKRKLDDSPNSLKVQKKKKKRKKKMRKDLKMYDILGDFTDSRLEEIADELQKSIDNDSESDIMKLLEEMMSFRISMNQIIGHKIGGVVNKLRDHKNEDINELCRRVVYNWKIIVRGYVQ